MPGPNSAPTRTPCPVDRDRSHISCSAKYRIASARRDQQRPQTGTQNGYGTSGPLVAHHSSWRRWGARVAISEPATLGGRPCRSSNGPRRSPCTAWDAPGAPRSRNRRAARPATCLVDHSNLRTLAVHVNADKTGIPGPSSRARSDTRTVNHRAEQGRRGWPRATPGPTPMGSGQDTLLDRFGQLWTAPEVPWMCHGRAAIPSTLTVKVDRRHHHRSEEHTV